MKKTLSLLVVFVILLSLCACGNEPKSDTTNSVQETSTGIEETSNNTTESTQATDTEETTVPAQESATTPSEKNNTKPTEKPIEPTKPTEKPIEPTKPAEKPIEPNNPTETTKPVHTHSYSAATCTQAKKCSCGATSGSALGHKWTNATCSTPKTCSVCEATEGNAAGHSWSAATCTAPKTCAICKKTEGSKAKHIVKGTTCKTCGQVVAIDPKNFNAEVSYVCVGNAGPHISENDGQTYNLFTLTYLKNDNWCYSVGGYVQSNSPYADWPQINGICYAPTAEWNGQSSGLNGGWSYQIIGSQIIISAEVDNFEYDYGMGNKAIITCQLLSDGTLKVVSISGFAIPQKTGIKIGTIFYPTT